MGAFDDLIPVQEAPRGPFDDLIPERTELGPAWPAQEGEEAPQTVPEEVSRFFRPPAPSNKLQIAPLADVNAPMPEPKSFMQEVSEPLVSYQLEHSANEGVLEAVGREAANLALGVAEFPTSELGVAAGVAGSLAPTATAGAFTLQMMKDLGNQVLSTYQNWGSMTPAQKAIALTDIAGTGVLGVLTGRATAKGLRRLGKTETAITAAEPILPQAAQAAKETKGAEYATEERNVQESVSGERAGDDALRAPTETSISGGVQPAAPSTPTQAPRTAPESRGLLLDTTKTKLKQIGWNDADIADLEAGNLSVPDIVARKLRPFDIEYGGGPEHAKALEEARFQAVADAEKILAEKPALSELTPEERLAEQRALDEALGQQESQLPIGLTGKLLINELMPEQILALAKNAGIKATAKDLQLESRRQSIISRLQELESKGLLDSSAIGKKPAPQAELTPTAIPPAEPSIPTPELPAAPGAKPIPSQVPISEATTAGEKTQEPFLGKTKAEWPDYYDTLDKRQKLLAISQTNRALASEGLRQRLTTQSRKTALLKAINEIIDLREKKKAEVPRTLLPEPPIEPLQAGLGIPGIEKLDRKFNELRQSLSGILRRGGERRQMDQTLDATETMSNVVARQATNQLRLNGTPAELNAIYPFIEAKGDINRLTHFIAQATGKNETAADAARYAQAHWNDPHFQALAARAKAISDAQIAQEQAAGINTEYRDAYLPHIYDQDLLMGFNRPFVIAGKGTGIGTGFKKGRTFETIYDAIEAGYPVKTLNAADALEPRIRSGQKLINRVEWSDSFRHVTDPVDGEPIVTSLVRHTRAPGKPGWEAPPAGYVRRTVIPGVDVAVHEGYASLWDALTGTSQISGSVPGKLALETEGALKHGLLLFDTFHVSRILQKELFLVGPKKMGWRKGLTLLEYSDAELAKALHENLITSDMANFARANRADAELLMRSGLNVGRIQENLYNSVVRQIPILGKFNKWVFEKMTRGAMLQSALIELERVQRDFGLTRQEAAMKAARDLNAYFGNLGRQGIFKSGTSMDVARLVALAPQWVESMLRTEVGSVAKGVIDPIKYRKLAVSSLPLAVGTGLAAYFVATQILNLVTRRHPTWENPEKGHKLDAWIPDFSGKTKGYFLSPFSVPAEITHDMIRYARTEPDTIAAASRILSNKASPLWRASKTLLTGKDWDQEKLIGSWDRIKAAAINLIPMPIGAAPLVMGEKYPGQAQRQITASLGIKTEQAPTAVQQISEIKRTWSEKNPNPKIRHAFEQSLKSEYPLSDYVPLRRALAVGDMAKAAKEYDALITEKGKKPVDIQEALRPITGGREVNGVYREAKLKPIGGQIGVEAEAKFKTSLTPAERKLYQQAIEERKMIWAKFLKLMETR